MEQTQIFFSTPPSSEEGIDDLHLAVAWLSPMEDQTHEKYIFCMLWLNSSDWIWVSMFLTLNGGIGYTRDDFQLKRIIFRSRNYWEEVCSSLLRPEFDIDTSLAAAVIIATTIIICPEHTHRSGSAVALPAFSKAVRFGHIMIRRELRRVCGISELFVFWLSSVLWFHPN